MDLQKAANISQIVSTISGLFFAYETWTTLPAGVASVNAGKAITGSLAVLLSSQAVLISFGTFVALLIVVAVLRLAASKRQANNKVRTLDENSPLSQGSATPRPTPTHQSRMEWKGVLEATASASLTTGETGRVIAHISHGAEGTLAQSELYKSQTKPWGPTQSGGCCIPFNVTGEQNIHSAAIRLELIIASKDAYCPKAAFDLDLAWDDTRREVPFQIQAIEPGRYVIDVVLLANSKYASSVQLSTEAHMRTNSKADAGAGTHDLYSEMARVRIELQILSKYEKGIKIEESIGNDEHLGYKTGHDQGMSM